MSGHYDNQDPPQWHPDPLTRALTKLDELEKKMEHFITDDEFRPVRLVVYGLVGMILMSVLGVLISQAIKK